MVCVCFREREGARAGTFSLIYLCCGQNDNLERDLSAAHFIMLNINKMRPGRLFHPDPARLLPTSQCEIPPTAQKGRTNVTVVFSFLAISKDTFTLLPNNGAVN